MSEKEATHDALAADLAALPTPPLDDRVARRALSRAHGELRLRGEGTFSVSGLLAFWDASLVPAIVLLTGFAYGALAFVRIVEIYEEGGFPLLVVDAKKDFARKYGLASDYWSYYDPAATPEQVSAHLTGDQSLAGLMTAEPASRLELVFLDRAAILAGRYGEAFRRLQIP